MGLEDAFEGQLVTLGEVSSAAETPSFDKAGALALETGESILLTREATITVWRTRPTDKAWSEQRTFQVPATLVITSRRLVYSWPNYKSDRSTGSFVERRVLTGLFEKADGKMLPAGHVRFPWITQVVRHSTQEGMLKKRTVSRVELRFEMQGFEFEVRVTGLDPAEADSLARSIAQAVAQERLERRGPANSALDEEDTTQLAAVAVGGGQKGDSPDRRGYPVPGGMKVPFDYKQELPAS